MQASHSVQKQITELQHLYATSLADKRMEITTCWMLAEQQHWHGDVVKKLHNVIYRLAHSAASYGFHDISAAAREIERYLNFQLLSADNLLDLHRALQSLCTLLTVYSQVGHSEHTVLATTIRQPHTTVHQQILLISCVEERTIQLSKLLEERGYNVQAYTQLPLQEKLRKFPCAIVFDSSALNAIEPRQLKYALRKHFPNVPHIFIADQDNFATRLRVAQVGTTAYLHSPISSAQLLTHLEEIFTLDDEEPHRVLIAVDDHDMGHLYRLALEHAGLQTLLINTPEELIAAFVEFNPELLLIDISLPECSSFELIALLRQEEAYLHIPALFLITETALKEDANEFNIHCSNYLIKPVPLEVLVQIIDHKTRQICCLIPAYDGLTGLLNQKTFLERLGGTLANAERSGSQIALSMIDIDNLKAINQQFNYWIGNQILKQIAKNLKQRLRRGDLLCRYRSDEFIIVLNDVDLMSAQEVMGEILEDLAKIVYTADTTIFYITLNAGIAHYPGHIPNNNEETIHKLLKSAEQALLTAKKQGCNQVMSYEL